MMRERDPQRKLNDADLAAQAREHAEVIRENAAKRWSTPGRFFFDRRLHPDLERAVRTELRQRGIYPRAAA